MIAIRSFLYFLWLYGLLVLMGLACAPVLLMPRRHVLAVVRTWARLQVWGLRWIAGVKVEFRGLEHLPKGAALIAGKHQGMLDTVAPLVAFEDPAYVLKRELMQAPVFGWYVAATKMVPIDREAQAKALKQLLRDAREQAAEGRQVVIFPEGTRQAPGAPPDYKPGVAALYRDLDLPCVPMATNSGVHWPAHGITRTPGIVVFEFLPPIPPGLKRDEFMARLQAELEGASNALLAEKI